ncbi:MAG: SGNH/GDSL hydrolase family protein, partial [Paracoccaceae bacterium]
GGGNDLLLGCGCMACHDTINELVSENARSGKIPDFLRTIRDNGSKILYIGYLRSPGLLTPIEHCKNEGDLFEARLAKFADREENIYFASMQNIVPYGDASYFSLDRIHPSRKTSKMIGEFAADFIGKHDDRK